MSALSLSSPKTRRKLALLCAGLVGIAAISQAGQHSKKYEEPKSQVQPLPPEPPAALAVDTDTLDFHISPLLKSGGLASQIRTSLNELLRDTHGETIVKLRAFVAGTGDARRVQALVTDLFTERKLPLPVLSILQVGALGQEHAQVVIEAVVSTHKTVNPNGLAFLFGQQGATLDAAIRKLRSDTDAIGVAPEHILTCTCFTGVISDYQTAVTSLHSLFPQAQPNFVQAVRDPVSQHTVCEATAQLSTPPPQGPVVLLDYAHATLVHSQQLIFTGLQLTFGGFLDDGETAFSRLTKTAKSVEAVETPVQVDAFALDPRAASMLRRTDSLAPGAFNVQDIEGLQAIDATGGIEAVMAPGISAATVIRKSGDTITR
jgi:hypothetical protein